MIIKTIVLCMMLSVSGCVFYGSVCKDIDFQFKEASVESESKDVKAVTPSGVIETGD